MRFTFHTTLAGIALCCLAPPSVVVDDLALRRGLASNIEAAESSISAKVDLDSLVVWSDECLTYHSFLGQPYPFDTLDAVSQIDMILTLDPKADGSGLVVDIQAVFMPNSSWIRMNSSELIKHEQGHFDICEVFARKARKQVASLKIQEYDAACREISEIYNEVRLEENAEHIKYDMETNHGREHATQARWNRNIGDRLNLNGAFSRTMWVLPIR